MDGLIDYSRQREFDNTMGQINRRGHIIVGCGGVGFWLGVILAMQGAEKFVLIDGQKIEPSNLNRIPVSPTWDKTNKAVALRKVIRTVRPQTAVLTMIKHVTTENLHTLDRFTNLGNWQVWDCTDDARIQVEIYKWQQELGTSRITYRKIGYEGFNVGTYVNYNVWMAQGYQPGYRTSNACAATSALAAVVGFMCHGLNLTNDVNLNIRKILTQISYPDAVSNERGEYVEETEEESEELHEPAR